MPVPHISVATLRTTIPYAFCVQCRKNALDAVEDEIWTIWAPQMIYCPQCAAKRGRAPDEC
jgi:hypothetical protein